MSAGAGWHLCIISEILSGSVTVIFERITITEDYTDALAAVLQRVESVSAPSYRTFFRIVWETICANDAFYLANRLGKYSPSSPVHSKGVYF